MAPPWQLLTQLLIHSFNKHVFRCLFYCHSSAWEAFSLLTKPIAWVADLRVWRFGTNRKQYHGPCLCRVHAFLPKTRLPPPLLPRVSNTLPDACQYYSPVPIRGNHTPTEPYVSGCFSPSAFSLLGQSYHHDHSHSLLVPSPPLPSSSSFPTLQPAGSVPGANLIGDSCSSPSMTPVALRWLPFPLPATLVSFRPPLHPTLSYPRASARAVLEAWITTTHPQYVSVLRPQ